VAASTCSCFKSHLWLVGQIVAAYGCFCYHAFPGQSSCRQALHLSCVYNPSRLANRLCVFAALHAVPAVGDPSQAHCRAARHQGVFGISSPAGEDQQQHAGVIHAHHSLLFRCIDLAVLDEKQGDALLQLQFLLDSLLKSSLTSLFIRCLLVLLLACMHIHIKEDMHAVSAHYPFTCQCK